MILRVCEGLVKDAGRGMARIDPADMGRLGIAVGDAIEIRGRRSTVARAMIAHAEHRGRGAIQIDGITRQNAGVTVGDEVEVAHARVAPAREVRLAGSRWAASYWDERRALGFLAGIPVVAGDLVRAGSVGSSNLEFTVIETEPAGPVILEPATRLHLVSEAAGPRCGGVSYEDIGGLGEEIRRLREMIELPLRRPEVFRRLGIEPPKGVLLYGPPGCGKTLLARAIAHESSAYFVSVDGPEIVHKYYGESEAHLRSIFEDAQKNAPAVLFIDEIDAIAPRRADVHGEVEKRIVAQLLALMDGLKDRGQVFVMAATNMPNSIDPALRRPGRFDCEIPLGVPDRRGRLEILQIHTRGIPIGPDVDLAAIADMTHGYVGADLQALCREAAMTALRRVVPGLDVAAVSEEDLAGMTVGMDDFLGALRRQDPSALREVFCDIPTVSWDDVGGLARVKARLREAVEWPLKYPAYFSALKCRPPKGVLLYGPPGTGKTLLARAAASESGANFISVRGPEVLSKYVGESEKAVREIFRKARQASPCIVFFDEVETLAPRRGAHGDSGVTERVVGQFLTEMDGISELGGVVVMAATNRVDLVDPALLRSGRFECRLELPLPDHDERKEIFAVHLRGRPVGDDVEASALADLAEGMSGADIEYVCRRAALLAIREAIERGLSPERTAIRRDHLVSAVREGAND